MKKIILGLVVVLMSACSSTPFKANVDNDLLVGKWTISKVDDSAALVNAEEFMLTAMHEKYKEGYFLNFAKGAQFQLANTEGTDVLAGQYSIGAEDKSVILQFGDDKTEIAYDLKKVKGGYDLIVTTPGELVNITITKTE